jgi:hypothetical protein
VCPAHGAPTAVTSNDSLTWWDVSSRATENLRLGRSSAWGRLGQETIDEVERGAALEQGRDIEPLKDQREGGRDHEVRGV